MYGNEQQDDGSLAFLQIAPDPNNKHFNCDETTQQKLVNTSFSREIKWVLDKIRERNAFPRKVTLRASGTRYYFE